MKPEIDMLRMEVLKNAFISITEEMSATLYRSAYSTNIKTRKDYSCALFDEKLRLVAQAFAQPAHLGVIRKCIPRAVEAYGQEGLCDGDILVVNDPYTGAAHLNDIALIMPVFQGPTRIGYVANMAHHVDVGGGAPASFYISKELYQEGIIIPPTRIVRRGVVNEDVFNLLARNVRSGKEFRGDIRAQVAANKTGAARFIELIQRFGNENLKTYIDGLIDYTERRTLKEFRSLPYGRYEAEDQIDDDGFSKEPIKIAVAVIIDESGILCDFSGTDKQRRSPMNATEAFPYTATSFVLKCLISDDIPVNDGFYKCVRIKTERGTVVNCMEPSGVVGGYEIGQRIISALFRAFSQAVPERVAAASKGNIGHFAFGGYNVEKKEGFAFLETIGGGSGGRTGKDGMEAVQCDLSNTENAPVEEMEINYPVQVSRYELIPDSGGPGKWRGGLGIRREYRFPENIPISVTVFSDRSKFPPWGLFGGLPARGAHFSMTPARGDRRLLSSKCFFDAGPGDMVTVESPGGGGYGNPLERETARVAHDVLCGKVTPAEARETYGAVVDTNGVVNEEATRKVRERLSRKSSAGDGEPQ